MPIPRGPRAHEDEFRIISEYILGSYYLTAEDMADPEATAAEIWTGLQSLPPDEYEFEADGSFEAEGVSVTQDDLRLYIEDRIAAKKGVTVTQ